jgi:anti-sigma regulatory factor (Ser/Thr protein kinase)
MKKTFDNPLCLELSSNPAELRAVRREIEALCERVGLEEEPAGRVALAVDEAITNIIRHAYDNCPDGTIRLQARREGGCLALVLRDYGRCVDPEQIRSRDLEDIRPGGLGVHIIRECMDTVDYQPVPEGGTRLTMTKRIAETKETP